MFHLSEIIAIFVSNKKQKIMDTTFHLEKGNLTKTGVPIRIRITRGRDHKVFNTSIRLKRNSDWNPEREEVRVSESRYKVWNEQLQIELEEARQVYREHKGDSLAELVDKIKNKDVSGSFLSFAKSKAEEWKSNRSIGHYKHCISGIQKVVDFLESKKKSDISFNEITIPFVKEYESYLGSVGNSREKGRTLKKSTIASYLKRLRTLVSAAEQEGYITSSPFGKGGKFSISDKEGGTKESLDIDELHRFADLDLPVGSAEWHTRNAYLFSFFCAGMRVGDTMQLRWDRVKDGRIEYAMDKTDTIKNWELPQGALDILALYKSENAKETDYIFPFLNSSADYAKESAKGTKTMPYELREVLYKKISSRTTIMNKNLKKIAEKAGITKNVTFHTSRHTFANFARILGVSPQTIQSLLGHQDLKVTQVYMNHLGSREEDDALKLVYGFAFKSKPAESPKEALISKFRRYDEETLAKALESLENG